MSSIGLTDKQLVELGRCIVSPEYFVETFCWLQQKASAGVSKTSATIPFTMGLTPEQPHYFQRRILRWLHNRDNVLTMKSRRVGCSWIAAAYVSWLINFHEGVNALFISRNGKEAIRILDKVRFILANLAYHDAKSIKKSTDASWLRSEIVANNTERISIAWRGDDGHINNTSAVESITTTDDSARGDDATFIVFDELGFYEHPEQTWSSATKALTLGGHWMAISTPNLIGDTFHRLCARGDLSELGKLDEPLGFKYIKIHWTEAGITEEQKERASVGDTDDKIRREWEWGFTSVGTVAFDPTHLAACYRPPAEYPDVAKEIEKYHKNVMSEKNRGSWIYYSGVDTSVAKIYRKASQKDYHAFTSLTNSGIQAFMYFSKESLGRWAGTRLDSGYIDGDGIVDVIGTVSKLHAEYPGLCYIEEEGPGLTVIHNHRLPPDGFSDIEPVSMKHLFKRNIIERLILRVENHQIIITDEFTYQCMMMYQQVGPGRYEAASGYFDDPVIALALATAALDSHGAFEFSWGRSADDLKRSPDSFEIAQKIDHKVPNFVLRDSEEISEILTESDKYDMDREYELLGQYLSAEDQIS